MKAIKPRTLAALVSLLVLSLSLVWIRPSSLLQAQTTNPFDQIINQIPPGNLPVGLAAMDGTVAVLVELNDAPVLRSPDVPTDPIARRNRLVQINTAQTRFRGNLPVLQAQELYSTKLIYNGIAIRLPVAQLAQLRRLPEVHDIHVLTAKRLSTIDSVPYIEAPAVWSANGATGRQTRIGIIDSGIDYTHAQFGGSGDPMAYTNNNPAFIEPGSFPTPKVAGGYDFAGNSYDANSSPFPSDDDGDGRPGDPDPLDCSGHGTLVAGAAAGSGVTASGTSYSGPYTNDLPLSTFRVGPGVAPEATLFALKVLGCAQTTGSDTPETDLLLPAIEWALDPNGDGDPSDHLDVISIALGSPFGSATDPDAVAVGVASAAGVVVVAAAGNTNDAFYSVNTPASAPSAIAVTPLYDLRAGAPGRPDSILPSSTRGPLRGHETTKPDIAAPGYAIRSAAVGSGSNAASASGSSMATPHVVGAAALLHQLHPTWKPVQIKAAMMNTATPIQNTEGVPYGPTYGGAGRLNIAAAARTTLLAYADTGNGGVGVDYGAPWIRDSFLLYQPIRVENLGNTPQQLGAGSFAAASEPSVTVRPADVSFTVPPNSSTVVRVRSQLTASQLDMTPDPTVELVQDGFQRFVVPEQTGSIYFVDSSNSRIRIANSSSEPSIDVYLDNTLIASNLRYGQVSEYVSRAPGAYTLAYYKTGVTPIINQEDPPDEEDSGPELGKRILNVGAGTDVTMLVRNVLNQPESLRTLTLNEAAVQGAAMIGRVRVVNNNPTNMPLPAGDVDVYIDGRRIATSMKPTSISNYVALAVGSHNVSFYTPGAAPETTAPLASSSFSVGTYDVLTLAAAPATTGAQISTIKSQPRATIRVPYALAPRPASQSTLVPSTLQLPAGTTSVSLTVTNADVAAPDPTNGLRPLLGAFELSYQSTTPPINDGIGSARLRYAGITTDYTLVGNVPFSQIFFAIAAQSSWTTPHEVEYEIFFDTNLDGQTDYILANSDLGTLLRKQPNDTFISTLCQRRTLPDGSSTCDLAQISYLNAFAPPNTGQPDLTPFDRSTMMLRVSADGLGLTAGASQFRYRIETRHRDKNSFAEVVDQSPWLSYDVSQPAIDTVNPAPQFGRTPIYLATNTTSMRVRLRPDLLAARPDAQILVFHFHNQLDNQVQLIPLRVGN